MDGWKVNLWIGFHNENVNCSKLSLGWKSSVEPWEERAPESRCKGVCPASLLLVVQAWVNHQAHPTSDHCHLLVSWWLKREVWAQWFLDVFFYWFSFYLSCIVSETTHHKEVPFHTASGLICGMREAALCGFTSWKSKESTCANSLMLSC